MWHLGKGTSLQTRREGDISARNPELRALLSKQLSAPNGSWEISSPFPLIEIPPRPHKLHMEEQPLANPRKSEFVAGNSPPTNVLGALGGHTGVEPEGFGDMAQRWKDPRPGRFLGAQVHVSCTNRV